MTLKIFAIGLFVINYEFISVKIRPNRFSLQNNVKSKSIKKLNIKYKDIERKQHLQVTYLGCVMDKTMSGEPMALKDANKINKKLKFLYWKNSFLTAGLRRMLCNALMQPHFDYACSAWYPKLNENL